MSKLVTNYIIKNKRTGLYWNAGKCDRASRYDATQFEDHERAFVTLYQDEVWERL